MKTNKDFQTSARELKLLVFILASHVASAAAVSFVTYYAKTFVTVEFSHFFRVSSQS